MSTDEEAKIRALLVEATRLLGRDPKVLLTLSDEDFADLVEEFREWLKLDAQTEDDRDA